MKNVRVELDDALHTRLKLLAVKQGRTIKEIVYELLMKYLKEHEEK